MARGSLQLIGASISVLMDIDRAINCVMQVVCFMVGVLEIHANEIAKHLTDEAITDDAHCVECIYITNIVKHFKRVSE